MKKFKLLLFAFLPIIISLLFFVTAIPSVDLGSAKQFAILSEAGITNVPTSAITGNIGTYPITGATMNTITCPEVSGIIYSTDATGPACKVTDSTLLHNAVGDWETAYTNALGLAPDFTNLYSGNLGGRILAPGVYNYGSAVTIPTDVTLSGGPNDVWVFQITGTLDISSATHVILSPGVNPDNVYWVVADVVHLGANSIFNGNILSQSTISMDQGATLNGRALSHTDVTLINNIVTIPTLSNLSQCIPSTDVRISNLQPDWNSTTSGRVFSAYYGPNNSYIPVSPGNVTNYNGRESAPVFAGLTIDPIDGIYEDQGLFAFNTSNTTVETFVTQSLSYTFTNQLGIAPVWIYIRLDRGLPSEVVYQFVPSQQPGYVENLNWHTVNASAGVWQKWTDAFNGDVAGNPQIPLSQIAVDNPGKILNRVYLTEGMGDSYNNGGTTTVAWVDNVTIGPVTYDFVLADMTTPVVTLNGNSTITLNVGDNYTEFGANVTDNVDSCLIITNTGIVDTNTVGTYTVTYNTTDSSGNTVQIVRTINVVAPIVPYQTSGGGGHRRKTTVNNTVNASCISNWICATVWTTCIDGEQSQVCTDIKGCSNDNEIINLQTCTTKETITVVNNTPTKPNYTPLWIVLGLIILASIIALASRKRKVPQKE